jgi:hypothetical protein
MKSKLIEIIKQHIETDDEVVDQMAEAIAAAFPVKTKSRNAKEYFAVEGAEFAAKCPLQMKQCVEVLRNAEEPLSIAAWAEQLAGVIKTKQPVERIIAFYRKRMLDEGLIAVYTGETDEEPEAEETEAEETATAE